MCSCWLVHSRLRCCCRRASLLGALLNMLLGRAEELGEGSLPSALCRWGCDHLRLILLCAFFWAGGSAGHMENTANSYVPVNYLFAIAASPGRFAPQMEPAVAAILLLLGPPHSIVHNRLHAS